MHLKRSLLISARFLITNTVRKSVPIVLGCMVTMFVMCYILYIRDETLESIKKACITDLNREFGNTLSRESEEAPVDFNENIVNVAKRVSKHNRAVLVSVVNDAFLPFAYSWLCNTKGMNVHKSVLIITTDQVSRYRLTKDWPDINVVTLNLDMPHGNQDYSHVGYLKIMIRRTEMLLDLLYADIEIMLLEFDYVWFANPLPRLQKMTGVDMLVNPVSRTQFNKVFNGGFLYIYPTKRSKYLWKRLTQLMTDLGKQLEKRSSGYAVSENDNDQVYFSKLVREGYGNITTRELPLDTYADGDWYMLTEAERKQSHPVVISNNFVEGNLNKLKRAKQWKHWFLRDDCTCDLDLVRKTVYK